MTDQHQTEDSQKGIGIRQFVFAVLDQETSAFPRISRMVNGFIIALIVLNLFAIMMESIEELALRYATFFLWFERISIAIFSLEYLLHLWVAPLRYADKHPVLAILRYMFTTMGIIDLLAILPFYLPLLLKIDLRFVRILRLVRLVRLLKLGRYSWTVRLIGTAVAEKRSELLLTLFVVLILLVVASVIMFNIEHEAQPEQFPNIFATFWWAIATLTTVGYGDVYPITGWGKFISGLIAVLGIGMVALPTGIISSAFIETLSEEKSANEPHDHAPSHESAREPVFRYCPHCGKPLLPPETQRNG
jgi:voltage-gated potassium channel